MDFGRLGVVLDFGRLCDYRIMKAFREKQLGLFRPLMGVTTRCANEGGYGGWKWIEKMILNFRVFENPNS